MKKLFLAKTADLFSFTTAYVDFTDRAARPAVPSTIGGRNPAFAGVPPGAPAPAELPSFSDEVEDEANTYFQRIYNQPPNQTMSIDEVLDMLKRFKESNNRRDRVSQLLLV